MLIDIYLPSLYSENLKKYQGLLADVAKKKSECMDEKEKEILQKEMQSLYKKQFSRGYFREGYDAISLLKTLGLKWKDIVIPFLNENGLCPIDVVAQLKEKIKAAKPVNMPTKMTRIEIDGEFVLRRVEMTTDEIESMRRKFLVLLDESIKRNEPLQITITKTIKYTQEQQMDLINQFKPLMPPSDDNDL